VISKDELSLKSDAVRMDCYFLSVVVVAVPIHCSADGAPWTPESRTRRPMALLVAGLGLDFVTLSRCLED
jgi:hypothetical protein